MNPDHDPDHPPGPLFRLAAWCILALARAALVVWKVRWRLGL